MTPWPWAPGPRAGSTNPCGSPTHPGLACVCAETPYTGLSGASHALGGRCEDRSQVLERPWASRRLCPVPEALPRRPCPPGPSGPSCSGQKARSLSTLLVPASGQPQARAPHQGPPRHVSSTLLLQKHNNKCKSKPQRGTTSPTRMARIKNKDNNKS